MVVELDFAGDICTVRIKGRFATGRDADYLRQKTDEIKNSGCRRVLADFKDVPYIDSTGIGFLIGVYTSIVRIENGRFAMANVNPHIQEVLRVTRLLNIFSVYPDETSAREALQGEAKAAAQREP